MNVHASNFAHPRTLPESLISDKFKKGVTDNRTISGYVPILNLLQSEKSLPANVRTVLNWILTSITVISNIILTVLKILGIGIGILSGPIGWAISFGLFALSVMLSLIAYKIAAKNPEKTFAETGYQIDSTPFCAGDFSHEDRMRIQVSSELCEKLSGERNPPTTPEYIWPIEFLAQKDALLGAGFEFAGKPNSVVLEDGRSVSLRRFRHAGLGIGFAVAEDSDRNKYFIPTFDTDHAERMAALASAICPWKDARTEAFEAAFQIALVACGDDIIPTGSYAEGASAQYLGLKYGCRTYCYNPYGIGPTHQQIIGQARMAQNAPKVFNFSARELQTPLQKFFDAIDLAITVLAGYTTLGNFGYRILIKLAGSSPATMSGAFRDKFAAEEAPSAANVGEAPSAANNALAAREASSAVNNALAAGEEARGEPGT
jgi:hypothetical protein